MATLRLALAQINPTVGDLGHNSDLIIHHIEKAEQERIKEAKELSKKVEEIKIIIPVAVSEEGTLYGSIGTREISEAIANEGIKIEKSSIRLPEGALKELGDFSIDIEFHPEVIKPVTISIKEQK